MANSEKLLEHDESENSDSVEPVSADLRAQVASGECVALRGTCMHHCRSAEKGRGTKL